MNHSMNHPDMVHAEFIAFASTTDRLDPMGYPFSTWRVCRYAEDCRALRDAAGRVVYETQAEWLARHGNPATPLAKPTQQDLFA